MKTNQWYLIGLAFLLLGQFFIQQDISLGITCKSLDSELDALTLSACIQAEIFEPFIWSFHVFWVVCWINGWLEKKVKP